MKSIVKWGLVILSILLLGCTTPDYCPIREGDLDKNRVVLDCVYEFCEEAGLKMTGYSECSALYKFFTDRYTINEQKGFVVKCININTSEISTYKTDKIYSCWKREER